LNAEQADACGGKNGPAPREQRPGAGWACIESQNQDDQDMDEPLEPQCHETFLSNESGRGRGLARTYRYLVLAKATITLGWKNKNLSESAKHTQVRLFGSPAIWGQLLPGGKICVRAAGDLPKILGFASLPCDRFAFVEALMIIFLATILHKSSRPGIVIKMITLK
jgi:hypothetical protein